MKEYHSQATEDIGINLSGSLTLVKVFHCLYLKQMGHSLPYEGFYFHLLFVLLGSL